MGLVVRAAVVGYAPVGTSGRNTKTGQRADVLNTTGMYSLVRHPLYLANFLMWIGVSLYCMLWWLTALFALIFWLYYERIMYAEEEFLRRRFGEAYLQWADRTPAFIPKLGPWVKPELSFSPRSVLRREYPGLFATIACFYGMHFYEHVFLEHRPDIDPIWTGIFIFGLVAFLGLRLIKRRTNLLLVEGR